MLAPLRAPWPQGLGRGGALERLDAGHLVGAHDVTAEGFQQRGVGIDGADRFDLLREGGRVLSFGLGSEPVATPVRLQIRLVLKNYAGKLTLRSASSRAAR